MKKLQSFRLLAPRQGGKGGSCSGGDSSGGSAILKDPTGELEAVLAQLSFSVAYWVSTSFLVGEVCLQLQCVSGLLNGRVPDESNPLRSCMAGAGSGLSVSGGCWLHYYHDSLSQAAAA